MGTYIDQYTKLPDYCVKMRRTNLGTTMILKTELVEDKAMFQRIYIYTSMHAKEGFYLGVGVWMVLMDAILKDHILGNY